MKLSKRAWLKSSAALLAPWWVRPAWQQQSARSAVVETPAHDVRMSPDFLDDILSYKKSFNRPSWALPGVARQIRFDGGPMFAASQLESGWNYLFDVDTPGFVGIIQALPSLVNFYTHDIERRLDEVRAAGYNWVWLSYHLGFAIQDEEEQRRQVRHVIQLAHARGMSTTAYISLTSLFTRSAFLRQPESKQWVQERHDGTPVAYANVPVRLMACVNKPGRLDHLKKVVSMAIDDGADDIHYDSIFNRCYCKYCKNAFRDYTQRVLGQAHEAPVNPGAQAPTDIEERTTAGGAAGDPVWALFVEFAGYTVARALAELDRHAKSVNPSVTLSANTHQIRFVDRVTDMTWSEDANTQGARIVDGKLHTPLAVYAWGQAVSGGQKPFQATVMPYHYWTIQPDVYYEFTVAEAASFQANFTMQAGYAFGTRMFRKEPETLAAWGGISKGLRFVEEHQQLFECARPIADVAVYYSHPSRTQADTLKRKYEWEGIVQSLFLAGTPVLMLIDETALAQGAARLAQELKAIILTEATSLSAEEIEFFNLYVNQGGQLIVSDHTGLYNSFFVKRSALPWSHEQAGIHVLEGRKWPQEPKEIQRILRSVLGRDSFIVVQGNGLQLANPTLTKGRAVVHVLNYDWKNPQSEVMVRMQTNRNSEWNKALQSSDTATWISPSQKDPVSLKIHRTGDSIGVVVPELKLTGLIVLDPTRG